MIIKTSDFNKAYKNLQASIRKLYLVQEKRLEINLRDSRLHIKKLKNFDGVFSFRITRRYRVLFYFQNLNTVIFFDIDHRKDIYK